MGLEENGGILSLGVKKFGEEERLNMRDELKIRAIFYLGFRVLDRSLQYKIR